jgi:hypothetical protein
LRWTFVSPSASVSREGASNFLAFLPVGPRLSLEATSVFLDRERFCHSSVHASHVETIEEAFHSSKDGGDVGLFGLPSFPLDDELSCASLNLPLPPSLAPHVITITPTATHRSYTIRTDCSHPPAGALDSGISPRCACLVVTSGHVPVVLLRWEHQGIRGRLLGRGRETRLDGGLHTAWFVRLFRPRGAKGSSEQGKDLQLTTTSVTCALCSSDILESESHVFALITLTPAHPFPFLFRPCPLPSSCLLLSSFLLSHLLAFLPSCFCYRLYPALDSTGLSSLSLLRLPTGPHRASTQGSLRPAQIESRRGHLQVVRQPEVRIQRHLVLLDLRAFAIKQICS